MSIKRIWLVRTGLLFIGMLFSVAGVSAGDETGLRSSNGSINIAVQVLGQQQASKPSFFDKAKQKFSDMFGDSEGGDASEQHYGSRNNPSGNPNGHGRGHGSGNADKNNNTPVGSPTARATRITPPKPITASTGRAAEEDQPSASASPAATPAQAARPAPAAASNASSTPTADSRTSSRSNAESNTPVATERTGTKPAVAAAAVPLRVENPAPVAEQDEIWKRMQMMRERSNFTPLSPETVNEESRNELARQDAERLRATRSPQTDSVSATPVARDAGDIQDTTGGSQSNVAERQERHVQRIQRQENANDFLKRTPAQETTRIGSNRFPHEANVASGSEQESGLVARAERQNLFPAHGNAPQDQPRHDTHSALTREDAVPSDFESRERPSRSFAGERSGSFADNRTTPSTASAQRTATPGNREMPARHRDGAPGTSFNPWGGGTVENTFATDQNTVNAPNAANSSVLSAPVAGNAPVAVADARKTLSVPTATPNVLIHTPRNTARNTPHTTTRNATTLSHKGESGGNASKTAFSSNSTMITVEGDESDQEKSLLVSPILELETAGPQRVIVGQESPYQITLFNRGGTAAEQFVLRIDLPAWIDVQLPEVSAGATSMTKSDAANGPRTFLWKIDRIEPKTEEQLVLHLVPKERKSFNLKMDYDFKRLTAVAPIEVQEPKIEMSLEGPGEVLWGNEEIYKLRVRNTGNGDAENVKLALLPGTSEPQGEDATCVLEQIKAGEEITIDVKAKALQSDVLDISVVASGPFALQAKAMRRVNVLRANLDVIVESPELLFVGNQAEYTVRVRNIGNASATGVDVLANVPLGAKYVSCTANGRATPQNEVVWNVESIPVGGEFTATVLCELKRQGTTKLEVAATDRTGLSTVSSGTTQVESIADLKMKIANPQGPVEISSEAVYTITINNNGTRAAEGVEIDTMFSDHIDPVGFEGLGGEITSTGHVLFEKIPTISPGQTISVKVRAKATQPGNHKIRAELSCQSNGLQLVHEESTYYYARRGTRIASSNPAPKELPQPTPKHNPAPAAPAPIQPKRSEPAPTTEPEPAAPAPISPFAGATPLPAPATPWK